VTGTHPCRALILTSGVGRSFISGIALKKTVRRSESIKYWPRAQESHGDNVGVMKLCVSYTMSGRHMYSSSRFKRSRCSERLFEAVSSKEEVATLSDPDIMMMTCLWK
jgi:hypothetical protein